VFYSDVIWTAEFASQQWLYDLTDYVKRRRSEFVPSTLETIEFEDRFFGAPKQTDAGFLYYRTDKVDQVPETWQGVYRQLEAPDGAWAFGRGARATIVLNLSDAAIRVTGPEGAIQVGTNRARDGERVAGTLQLHPWEGAVILPD